MYRAILVPLDGSAFGEQALPLALSIARRAGATVRLAHVHGAERSPFVDRLGLPGDAADEQARAAERAYLDRHAQCIASSQDIPIDVALLDGPVAAALGDHARAAGVDLIVMSTHGRGALGRVWLGSVAAALVRQAPVPILLVRPHEELTNPAQEPDFRHVLIPLDGSPLAEQAIEPAIALGALTQARYTLLQALDPLVAEHTHPPYAVGLERRLLADVKEKATAYLERVAARLRARSLCVETTLVVGSPAHAICDYARAHAVDLIAMATHGHGGLSRVLLGSVTDAVVHAADMAVLLERPCDLVV
jgi:nucleotide-binding universal stress UspA family protein